MVLTYTSAYPSNFLCNSSGVTFSAFFNLKVQIFSLCLVKLSLHLTPWLTPTDFSDLTLTATSLGKLLDPLHSQTR